MVKQPALMGPTGPELRSPVHDELLSMHAFLYRELYGADVSEDEGCTVAVEVTAIAAESLARTMAAVRGGVDPESDELLSENIVGLLNQAKEDGPILDIDSVFYGQDTVNEELVARLADTAFAVSNAAYIRARDGALVTATANNTAQQLELAIPGLQPGLPHPQPSPTLVVYSAERETAGAHWAGVRELERWGLTMEHVEDFYRAGLPTADQEIAGEEYFRATLAAPDSDDYKCYQLLTRSASLLKLLAKEKAGQDMADLLKVRGELTNQVEPQPGEGWILGRNYHGEAYLDDGMPEGKDPFLEFYRPSSYDDPYSSLDDSEWDRTDGPGVYVVTENRDSKLAWLLGPFPTGDKEALNG